MKRAHKPQKLQSPIKNLGKSLIMSTILASQDAKAAGEQNRIGKQQQRERDKSLGERHHKSVANRESHAKQIQQVAKGSRRDTGFAISNG